MRVGSVKLPYNILRGYYSPHHGYTFNPLKAQKWAEQIHTGTITPEPVIVLKPKPAATRKSKRKRSRVRPKKSTPKRPYSQEEIQYIMRHMAKRGISHFAAHFGRTYRDVFNFIQTIRENAPNGRSASEQEAPPRKERGQEG